MGSQKTLLHLWYRLGMTYTNLQIYDSASSYLEKTLTSPTIARDTLQLVICLDALATLRSYQTDYAASVEYSLQAVMLIDQSRVVNIRNVLPQNYGRVAYNFIYVKQYDKAIKYGKKGLILREYSSEERHRTMLFLCISKQAA